jgi:PBP1b-binding outer membrane lipoprotein LpoB
MKKITLLATFVALFLASCQHPERQVKLNFDNEKIANSSVGNGKDLTIIAIDARKGCQHSW